MKLLFLIGIIPIFLCLSSVLAIDITTCQNITTFGSYRLMNNITTTYNQCGNPSSYLTCLMINASSVTLNLNGYSLIDNGTCPYGIVILPKNVIDFSDGWTDIKILNGQIIGFTSGMIEIVGGIDDSEISYINFYNTKGEGDGIAIDSDQTDNLMIGSNWFIDINNAVIGTCGSNCKLYDNEIRHAVNGFYLNGNGFDIQRNLMGYSVKNDTSCYKDDYPIDSGIFCNNCTTSIIKNNDIMAQDSLNVNNEANNNNITGNVFRTYYNYQPIITFASTTTDNIFCNNQVIRGYPTIVYDFNNELNVCFWGTQLTNAKSIVSDLGNNTIPELCTSDCSPNWFCNGNYRIYINSTCGVSDNRTCEYGCESGIYGSYCIGNETIVTTIISTTSTIPINEQYNYSYTTPIINTTDLSDAGVLFMVPFFTPIFWMFMIEIILSSVISWISKQAVTFPITVFMLSLIFSYLGIMPLFITAISCIVTALLTAFMFKNMTK